MADAKYHVVVHLANDDSLHYDEGVDFDILEVGERAFYKIKDLDDVVIGFVNVDYVTALSLEKVE